MSTSATRPRAALERSFVLRDRAQAAAGDPAARCRAVEVELEFGVEVSELQADLVGAHAANSLVRGLGEFGTKVEPEGSKYVWFGTDHVFDAFVRLQGDGGRAHTRATRAACPVHRRVSPRETWLGAGHEDMSEEETWRTASSCSRAISAAAAVLEPLGLARLPEGDEQGLARRTRRAPRCGPHRALLDRVGHQARDGGLDCARERAGAAGLGRRGGTARLRAGAWAGGADAGGRRERRLLPASRELYASRADPVRVQPPDPQRQDHAREPGDPRPTVHARSTPGSAVPRSRRRRSLLRAPRRPVRERFGLVPSGLVAVSAEGRVTPAADDRRVARPSGQVLLRSAMPAGARNGHVRSGSTCRSRRAGRSSRRADPMARSVPSQASRTRRRSAAVRRGGATGRPQRRRARAGHGARISARELPLAA